MTILRVVLLSVVVAVTSWGATADVNALVLQSISRMPKGGSYSTQTVAHQRLSAAIRNAESALEVRHTAAAPSFCSGGTYLVFLDVIAELHRAGDIALSPVVREALLVGMSQPDGHGVWGRWNANGPGTARLFAETGLGVNFTDWSQARAGDFMKIWWTNEIGARERGHSVVYLGTEQVNGIEHVRFWSSNKPAGYGEKTVPLTDVKWAVFSRLERPARISRVTALPSVENFLASMLRVPATREQVVSLCRVQE